MKSVEILTLGATIKEKTNKMEIIKMAQFPEYFPKNCPPKEAFPTDIIAYRFSKLPINPDGWDWIPANNSTTKKIENSNDKNYINAFGLSFFINYDDCKELLKIPSFRNKAIVVGEIKTEHGVILHTPSEKHPNHHTIWLYKDVCFCEIFRTVGDNDVI